MKRKLLFLVCLLLVGCEQKQRVDDANPIVTPGMTIEDAIALVRQEGFSIEESTPAVASTDESIVVLYYKIEPTHRPKDALFFVTHSHEGEEEEIIEDIFWHLDYEADSKLSKVDQKNNYQLLDRINLRTLKNTNAE